MVAGGRASRLLASVRLADTAVPASRLSGAAVPTSPVRDESSYGLALLPLLFCASPSGTRRGRGCRLVGECSSGAGQRGDRGLAGLVALGAFDGPLCGLFVAFGLVGGVVEVAGEGGRFVKVDLGEQGEEVADGSAGSGEDVVAGVGQVDEHLGEITSGPPGCHNGGEGSRPAVGGVGPRPAGAARVGPPGQHQGGSRCPGAVCPPSKTPCCGRCAARSAVPVPRRGSFRVGFGGNPFLS